MIGEIILKGAFWVFFSTALVQSLTGFLQMEGFDSYGQAFNSLARGAMLFLAAIAIGVYQ